MSNIKRLLEELQEDFMQVKGFINVRDLTAKAFLNDKAGLVDEEWKEHLLNHGGHPSMNCHYCVANADIPEEEVEE